MNVDRLSRFLCGRITVTSALVKVTVFIGLIFVTYSVIGQNNMELEVMARDVTTSITRQKPTFPPALPENTNLIIYNRVPKCASTGIRLIMDTLTKYNKFNLNISKIFDKERLNWEQESELIKTLSQNKQPSVYVRHVHFINFTRHGYPQPIYINVVREPLQRLVSDYYFVRYHLGYMFPMAEEDKNRTYDECVQTGLPECTRAVPGGFYRVIPYFCGQDPQCLTPSQWSLDRAKENVIRYYSVVGIAEDVDSFMEVIETMFPAYFRGAAKLFQLKKDYLKNRLKTKKKLPPSNTTIEIMKEKLKYDYDFYYFIKQRLYDLRNSLKVNIL